MSTDTRPAPVNPKPFKARHFRPIRVELTDRDAKYAGEGVESGTYEMHPGGSFKSVRVYARKLPRGARVSGTPQLRRVKHRPTIMAVVEKANGTK